MICGILWDNDGVLVDTERLYYEVNRDLLAKHGAELTQQNFFDWYLCESRGALHLLSAKGATEAEIEVLRTQRNADYTQRLRSEKNLVVPGMTPVVEQLSRRVPMGIVTSARREHFEAMHRATELLPYFQFALTRESYAESKPSPEPYLLGLHKLGLPAERCIVVEDSPRGLQSAIGAGLRCIIVRSEMTRHFEFLGAHKVVDSPQELLAAINEAAES